MSLTNESKGWMAALLTFTLGMWVLFWFILQLKLPIFKQFHKFIIGKGGATIKQIRQETNAKIDLPASGSDSDIIILTGKKEDVLKAQKKIQTIQSEQADVVSFITILITHNQFMMFSNRYVEWYISQWIQFSSLTW